MSTRETISPFGNRFARRLAAATAAFALGAGARAQDCDPHMMLRFDGVDDFVWVTGESTLPLEKFSVGAWIRTSSYGTERRGIVSRGEDPTTDHIPWALELWVDGTIMVEIEDAADNNIFYGGTIFVADGLWHHVAATRDGNGDVVLYVDGAIDVTHTGTLTPIDGTGLAHVGNLSLEHPASQYGHFGGDIDEVFMVAEAVDKDVIAKIHDGGVDPLLDNLQCFLKFDEFDGQKLADSGLGGHTGVLGADTIVDVDDPLHAVSQAPICASKLELRFNFEIHKLTGSDPFASIAWGGKPGAPQLLVIAAVNGVPTFLPVLFDYFDANGEYPIAGSVPPGLPAVDLTLITYGIVPSGKVRASDTQDIALY